MGAKPIPAIVVLCLHHSLSLCLILSFDLKDILICVDRRRKMLVTISWFGGYRFEPIVDSANSFNPTISSLMDSGAQMGR
jgi:hypothetical protein